MIIFRQIIVFKYYKFLEIIFDIIEIIVNNGSAAHESHSICCDLTHTQIRLAMIDSFESMRTIVRCMPLYACCMVWTGH